MLGSYVPDRIDDVAGETRHISYKRGLHEHSRCDDTARTKRAPGPFFLASGTIVKEPGKRRFFRLALTRAFVAPREEDARVPLFTDARK